MNAHFYRKMRVFSGFIYLFFWGGGGWGNKRAESYIPVNCLSSFALAFAVMFIQLFLIEPLAILVIDL